MISLKVFKLKLTWFCLIVSLLCWDTIQSKNIDSLLLELQNADNPKTQSILLNEISNFYRRYNADSAYIYANKAKIISEKHNLKVQKIEAYNELGIILFKKNQVDSSSFYLNKGLNLATKVEDNYGALKSLNSLGLYAYYKKDYEKATLYFNKAQELVPLVNNKVLLLMAFNNIALLYRATDKPNLSLEYYHKALLISEEVNDLTGMGIILSNMGYLYQKQNETDLALQYLLRSLDIRKQTGNKKGESYVLLNLGVVNEELGNYRLALSYYHKSLHIKEKLKHKAGIAILYNNIAIILKKQHKLDSASIYSQKSLKLRIELKDQLGESRTRLTIGQLHLLNNNFNKAEHELKKALHLAQQFKNIEVHRNIHKSLYEVYYSQKQFKNAIHHIIKMNAFEDSLFNIDKEKSIANIEAKYNTLKKEKENTILLKENEIKDNKIKRQIMFGSTLIGMLISITILLIFVSNSRNKLKYKNKKINDQAKKLSKAYIKQKQLSYFNETMTNMLVHDLKTPLTTIINLKLIKNKELQENIVQQTGYKMLRLVQNILDVYKYDNTTMELTKSPLYLIDILYAALDEVEFLSREKLLEFRFNRHNSFYLNADKGILRRVFVNLLTNAIKFSPSGGRIEIKTDLKESGFTRISILNQGKSIPKDMQSVIFKRFKQVEKRSSGNINSTGLGLTFCKMAVEAHGGQIGVVSEGDVGVEFWFTLPHDNNYEYGNKHDSVFEAVRIQFSNEEMQYLQPYFIRLKECKVFQATTIHKILEEINYKGLNLSQWRSSIEKAMYHGNEEKYNELLNL